MFINLDADFEAKLFGGFFEIETNNVKNLTLEFWLDIWMILKRQNVRLSFKHHKYWTTFRSSVLLSRERGWWKLTLEFNS